MRLAIIGTGYVGLVTGTCFAEMGNDVVCVDIDEAKVRSLSEGKLPLFEPGLVVFFERSLREARLSFTVDLSEAVPEADVVFLSLPTPPNEDGSADLTYVKEASMQLAPLLRGYTVVVSKSTVPVGTTVELAAIIETGKVGDATFDVVSNPEFLREGVAVDDFMKPERVVVGSSSEKATDVMRRLYEPFLRSGNPIIAMDERSAEMTKYAANSFLATKISFMNEVAQVCRAVGANVDHVRRGIGSDSRIGKQFLYAGIGYGGSCFPKDVSALRRTAVENGYDFQILKAVEAVNEQQRRWLPERVKSHFKGRLEGRKVTVWGLAFKANTDDMREAPSLDVIRSLTESGASVVAFDPVATSTAREVLGEQIAYAEDAYEALDGAEALVICTEWNEFRRPSFPKIRQAMSGNAIFDGRNLYDPVELAAAGFHYESIGRPTYPPS